MEPPDRDGGWTVAFAATLVAPAGTVAEMVRGSRQPSLPKARRRSPRGDRGRAADRRLRVGGDTAPGTPVRATGRRPHAASTCRAAFARVVLDLAAVVAAPDLPERVHRAAPKEVGPARRALAAPA